jgi:hypothetical protein
MSEPTKVSHLLGFQIAGSTKKAHPPVVDGLSSRLFEKKPFR